MVDMDWMEIQQNIEEVRGKVQSALEEGYEKKNDDEKIYINRFGVPFKVDIMGYREPWNALVIEYQDDFEDGDLYYPDDYESFDALLKDMKAEIDNAEPDNG